MKQKIFTKCNFFPKRLTFVLYVRKHFMSVPMVGSWSLSPLFAPIGLPRKLLVISLERLGDIVLWLTSLRMRWTVLPSLESFTLLKNGHIEFETRSCICLVFSAMIFLPLCLSFLHFLAETGSVTPLLLCSIFQVFLLCRCHQRFWCGGTPCLLFRWCSVIRSPVPLSFWGQRAVLAFLAVDAWSGQSFFLFRGVCHGSSVGGRWRAS